MKPIDIIIIVAVVAFFGYSLYRMAGTFTGKRDCCSGKAKDGGSAKRVVVADKNEAHYPNTARYAVSGMHCAHCAARVEDALNSIDGTWAEVDLPTNTVQVRSKGELDEKAYAGAVAAAGYQLAGAAR